MFTGLIEEVGSLESMNSLSEGVELTIRSSFSRETRIDQSISVNGVCLTIVDKGKDAFTVHCVKETLSKTALAELQEGEPVNLERSLTLQERIEGHLVQGHVDRVGTITDIKTEGDDRLYEIGFPSDDTDLIVPRGSIAVDGISLTVARRSAEDRFLVAVIPYTYQNTNLESKKTGNSVNLEYDILGKYAVHYMERRQKENKTSGEPSRPESLTMDWLRERGY